MVSNTSYDYMPHTIVSVIASFDTKGHVRPLYVRIGEESYKVHSSWLKPSFRGILEFRCQIVDGDSLKPLILEYHQSENVWIIPNRRFN